MAIRLPILLLLVLLTAAPSRGQQIDSTLVARFQLAESYLRSAQFDRAILLLEDLRTRQPGQVVFQERLREAYESVKRYDEALGLLADRMQREGRQTVLLTQMARIHFLKGDEELALDTFAEAETINPETPGTYIAIYRTMLELRLFEPAIGVLERGRGALANERLFQTDLAYLYGLTGDHAGAMREYLEVLRANPRQITFVRGRLASIMDDAEARDVAIPVAERAVESDPLNRGFRELLAWLYMESGRYADALDVNRAIDRLEGEQGQVLYAFAQAAADAAAYDVALEAFGEILSRYPDAPVVAEARQATGRMYERWAERDGELRDSLYAEARTAYAGFLRAHPGHGLEAEVRFRIGRIQQQVLLDLAAAEATLDSVRTGYPNTPAADRAALELGRIAVERGDLDRAIVRFSQLSERLRSGELAEAARFELAQVHFYRAEFDAAQAIAESMKDNTAADVSNDAIGLKVLLIESRGPDSLDTALTRYAAAQLQHRQRDLPAALATVDSLLATLGNHPLLDEAQFLRAQLLAGTGLFEESAAAFKEFPLIHPGSHLADRSLWRAAEIEWQDLGDPEAAMETLSRLLTDYPGSLLASAARDRLRTIRGDVL